MISLAVKNKGMAESKLIALLLNLLGIPIYALALLTIPDLIIRISLAVPATLFAWIKVLHAREIMLDKRIDRKTKERNFKYNRTIQEEEEEELEKYKPNRKNKLP